MIFQALATLDDVAMQQMPRGVFTHVKTLYAHRLADAWFEVGCEKLDLGKKTQRGAGSNADDSLTHGMEAERALKQSLEVGPVTPTWAALTGQTRVAVACDPEGNRHIAQAYIIYSKLSECLMLQYTAALGSKSPFATNAVGKGSIFDSVTPPQIARLREARRTAELALAILPTGLAPMQQSLPSYQLGMVLSNAAATGLDGATYQMAIAAFARAHPADQLAARQSQFVKVNLAALQGSAADHQRVLAAAGVTIDHQRPGLCAWPKGIKPGARVEVFGLVSKPEYNGQTGVATAMTPTGRVGIRFDDGGPELALKPANFKAEVLKRST